MKLAILGTEDSSKAMLNRVSESCNATWLQYSEVGAQNWSEYQGVIDLNFDAHPENLKEYLNFPQTFFCLNAVNIPLEKVFDQYKFSYQNQWFIGINGLPYFIERHVLEATNPFNIDTEKIRSFITSLGFQDISIVESRCGMVTPRIIFMIINEAWFTFQEGTAEKADIDISMKLGTNYPFGPFEWGEKIGLKNIVNTLDALWNDTHDERYKVCASLRQASYSTLNSGS